MIDGVNTVVSININTVSVTKMQSLGSGFRSAGSAIFWLSGLIFKNVQNSIIFPK